MVLAIVASSQEVSRVPVTVAPRSTDTQDDRDLAQRVADLEALIEEARRRARRRRRLYAAAALAAAGAVGAGLFGVGGNGHGSLGGTVAEGGTASVATRLGPGRWAPSLGPYGGGLTLAVDPTNPEILYAGGWGNVFKSTDGGGSWKDVTIEPWNRVGALAVDPAQHRVVYAGTDRGVAKTMDGGRSWRMVNGGLYDKLTRGRYGEGVGSLVIDAHDPQTVYAVKQGALFRTTDGGSHWRILGPAPYRTLRCPHCAVLIYGYEVAAAIDPNHAQTIYASWNRGTSLNFYESTDRGDSWHRIEPQGSSRPSSLWSLAVDGNGTLFATAGSAAGPLPGVVKSSDGGVTWSSAGLTGQSVWSLEVDSGMLYASTEAGLFRTGDGGASWQPVGHGVNLPGGSVIADPRDANTVYGIGDGVVKSVDGGRTWASADNGLVSTLIPSLALAPGSSKILYAGGYGGVFKSSDGGRSWRLANGLGTSPVDTLAVDPQNSRTLYAAESWHGGLFTSSDAGVHWSPVSTPFPSKSVQALAIDPQHPRTIYVADCGGACAGGTLQRTDDGGVTWTRITGIPWAVRSLAIDPQRPNTVFAGTTRGDIFRSSDGARSWHQVAAAPTLPQSHQYAIVKIVIDPRDPDTVYAARAAGGIVKSSDGGKTWRRANTGLTDSHVNALAIDPRDSGILYLSTGAPATSTPARVFRSTDGARTWHSLSAGVPAVGVTAFAIDSSGHAVFAATEGDGVIQLRRGG
jgi:photosystem II stability/assembly factor-like uncharacterized protein